MKGANKGRVTRGKNLLLYLSRPSKIFFFFSL